MFRIAKILRALVAAAFLVGAFPPRAGHYLQGPGPDHRDAVDIDRAGRRRSRPWHRSTPSDIYIATNQTYSNQAINVTAVSGLMTGINFIGGVPDCKTLQPSGTTSLNGGSGWPCDHRTRHDGCEDLAPDALRWPRRQRRGARLRRRRQRWTIDNSTISDNSAGNGGGIRVQGNGGAADDER